MTSQLEDFGRTNHGHCLDRPRGPPLLPWHSHGSVPPEMEDEDALCVTWRDCASQSHVPKNLLYRLYMYTLRTPRKIQFDSRSGTK